VMFHPLNTITAYKGQIIYDTPATEAKAQTPIPQLTWIPAKGAPSAPTQNPADLQALLVPTAPQAGPPPGPAAAPAPGPVPGSAFGPLPGPAPNQGPSAGLQNGQGGGG
jgi:phospholipid/cholesterol/gamma-HCH transport system substrate-binding protein